MARIATCLAAAAPRQPSCHMPSRYQLFPRDRPCAQALDPEKAFAYAMGSNKATSLAPLRLRPSPTRRRKPSIHDPSHMTVHELPMDSRMPYPLPQRLLADQPASHHSWPAAS